MATEICAHRQPGPADAPVEVVERKGLGHPDTLADALAERMSVAYCLYCQENFGAVLHHNLDKLYLRGGHCRTGLGVFEMTAPVTLVIGGRVSTSFGGQPIDHRGLFEQVARDYLATVLPGFDHGRWLRIEHATTDRSRFPAWFHPRDHDDLPELASPAASDTAAVTGWWPHTPVERLALVLERYLNQEGRGPRDPRLGQDIKIMAIRRDQHVDVTLNVAVHPLAAPDTASYDTILTLLHGELDALTAQTLGGMLSHRLRLNSGDTNPYRGKRHYLLGSGSCLEFGEEGLVGRGNTPSGLIPIHRPKSAEAAFGKNPAYHAGKVYALYTEAIARAIHAATSAPAAVTIVSRHSDPLREPALTHVALHADASLTTAANVTRDVLATTDHAASAASSNVTSRTFTSSALPGLRALTTERPEVSGQRMRDICAAHGVAVVFVEEITGARASGATRWLTPSKALVQLSLRYRTDDHLWFTFFHEIAHVLLHGKKDVWIEGDSPAADDPREAEADRFSRDILIPPGAVP